MPRRERRKSAKRTPLSRDTFFGKETTPGELYRGIIVERETFEKREKLLKVRENLYVRYCKGVYKRFPSLGKGAKFKSEYRDAVEFLGWKLDAEEFAGTVKFTMFLVLILGASAGILAYIFAGPILDKLLQMPVMTPLYIFAPVVITALFLTNYIQRYPLSAAKIEQTRALTYVPEIIGYMIMSMKLVPNLEKAVEFAAEHGRGKIAGDFRKVIWETQVGVSTSLSEALDRLAYRWGNFSDEFKHALMMVRASVLENTEAKRYQLLDKTMETILESIKTKMEQYARNLQQPAVLLFYLGVLLPLTLIIILPVGSAFTGQAMATPLVLLFIYNIAIPLMAIIFAVMLIKQRPPTYDPPTIPDDFHELPPKWKMKVGKSKLDIRAVVVLVFIAGLAGSVFLSSQGLPPKMFLSEDELQLQILAFDKSEADVFETDNKPEGYFNIDPPGTRLIQLQQRGVARDKAIETVTFEKAQFFAEPRNDTTPYNLAFGLLITISVCAFIALHYTNIYKRKVQLDTMEMESEFKDSLYILASRMGENKPVEEALRHTRSFLPNLKISEKIFGKTVENIELMGMPLEAAFFDPNYGSLKDIPSTTIKSSIKLMVDSVQLGVNVAARSLISLSLQLRNSEKVAKMLSTLVSDVTSMMKTMSVFIAPIVLGITTSLQKIVMLTLAAIVSSGIGESLDELSSGASIPGAPSMNLPSGFAMDPAVFQTMVTPLQFLVIIAIYVIELVLIMIYFTTKIEEDNNTLLKLNIAKALPISMIVFVVAVIVSNMFVTGFMG